MPTEKTSGELSDPEPSPPALRRSERIRLQVKQNVSYKEQSLKDLMKLGIGENVRKKTRRQKHRKKAVKYRSKGQNTTATDEWDIREALELWRRGVDEGAAWRNRRDQADFDGDEYDDTNMGFGDGTEKERKEKQPQKRKSALERDNDRKKSVRFEEQATDFEWTAEEINNESSTGPRTRQKDFEIDEMDHEPIIETPESQEITEKEHSEVQRVENVKVTVCVGDCEHLGQKFSMKTDKTKSQKSYQQQEKSGNSMALKQKVEKTPNVFKVLVQVDVSMKGDRLQMSSPEPVKPMNSYPVVEKIFEDDLMDMAPVGKTKKPIQTLLAPVKITKQVAKVNAFESKVVELEEETLEMEDLKSKEVTKSKEGVSSMVELNAPTNENVQNSTPEPEKPKGRDATIKQSVKEIPNNVVPVLARKEDQKQVENMDSEVSMLVGTQDSRTEEGAEVWHGLAEKNRVAKLVSKPTRCFQKVFLDDSIDEGPRDASEVMPEPRKDPCQMPPSSMPSGEVPTSTLVARNSGSFSVAHRPSGPHASFQSTLGFTEAPPQPFFFQEKKSATSLVNFGCKLMDNNANSDSGGLMMGFKVQKLPGTGAERKETGSEVKPLNDTFYLLNSSVGLNESVHEKKIEQILHKQGFEFLEASDIVSLPSKNSFKIGDIGMGQIRFRVKNTEKIRILHNFLRMDHHDELVEQFNLEVHSYDRYNWLFVREDCDDLQGSLETLMFLCFCSIFSAPSECFYYNGDNFGQKDRKYTFEMILKDPEFKFRSELKLAYFALSRAAKRRVEHVAHKHGIESKDWKLDSLVFTDLANFVEEGNVVFPRLYNGSMCILAFKVEAPPTSNLIIYAQFGYVGAGRVVRLPIGRVYGDKAVTVTVKFKSVKNDEKDPKEVFSVGEEDDDVAGELQILLV